MRPSQGAWRRRASRSGASRHRTPAGRCCSSTIACRGRPKRRQCGSSRSPSPFAEPGTMWAAAFALLILAGCSGTTRPEAPGVAPRNAVFQSAGYRLEGTLTSPVRLASAGALIIGGSGPVDRDGGSRMASLPPIYRWWAEELGLAGFAVLRYDKRFLTHPAIDIASFDRSEEHTSELQSLRHLVCRLLLEKKKM